MRKPGDTGPPANFHGALCVQVKNLCGPPGTPPITPGGLREWHAAGMVPANASARLRAECTRWELEPTGGPSWNSTRGEWSYAAGSGPISRTWSDGVHQAGWVSGGMAVSV